MCWPKFPLDEEIKKTLPGEHGRHRPIFEVVLDYESGTWEQLAHSARISLQQEILRDSYLRSIRWVTEVLAEAPVVVCPNLQRTDSSNTSCAMLNALFAAGTPQ